jgi:hypothetical protein
VQTEERERVCKLWGEPRLTRFMRGRPQFTNPHWSQLPCMRVGAVSYSRFSWLKRCHKACRSVHLVLHCLAYIALPPPASILFQRERETETRDLSLRTWNQPLKDSFARTEKSIHFLLLHVKPIKRELQTGLKKGSLDLLTTTN